MKQSSGTLLFRQGDEGLEVLLVHPSGAYNRNRPWSIPKGEPDEGEPDLEKTARRETLEETGVATESLVPLGSIDYRKSRKRIHCFAGPAPASASPHPASWEVDQARFVPLPQAREMLHPDQSPFLDRLVEHLQKEQGA
jgi:predicted NUDIX family NTP pyrophosphohydrolase